MRIFLDNCSPHIIMKRILPIWAKMNISHTNNPEENNIDIQLSFVKERTKTKYPILDRVDGIYYDRATNYDDRNKSISSLHEKADGIIYQSQVSQIMCEKYLKKRKTKIFNIVYNGIEENWSGAHKEHDGINIVLFSKWRRFKRLSEIISIFLDYQKEIKNSKLHIFGELYDNKKINHKDVIYHGMVRDRDRMKDILNISDMSLHLAKKDACPNSVVETIGCGIPVIVSNGCGGATEMAEMTNGCVICSGDNICYDSEYIYKDDYNKISNKLRKNIINAMIEISKDKRRVKLPKELEIETTAKKYSELAKRVINGK